MAERDGDEPGGGSKDDDHRIPGEEDSPFWVDRDPFLDRRSVVLRSEGEPGKPEQKAEAKPEKPEQKAEPAKPEQKAKPKAESEQQSGQIATGATETSPRRASGAPAAKVSVDPALVAAAKREQRTPRQASAASQTDPATPTSPKRSTPPKTSAGGGAPPRRDELPGDGRRPRRRFLLPIWLWVLIVIGATAAALAVVDLRTTKRYRLICKQKHLQFQQAKRFPWPFGYTTQGGTLRPVSVASEGDCITQHFADKEEAEGAFLAFVLTQVRAAIADPATRSLAAARAQIEQVRPLTNRDAHGARAKEVKLLLADLSYRGARARLARVEMTLREALSLFQRAQKLGGDRYEDLEDWIAHLERLLRSVAPSPTQQTPALSTTIPKGKGKLKGAPRLPTRRRSPTAPPLLPGKPPASPSDGGVSADAGAPAGSGILM